MKRSGVGQDRDVNMGRDFDREWDSERLYDVEHHFSTRSSGWIEPVDLAVPAVAGMVVDVDREVAVESRDAGPGVVAALHDDRGVVIAVDRGRDLDIADSGESHELLRGRVEVHDRHVLA